MQPSRKFFKKYILFSLLAFGVFHLSACQNQEIPSISSVVPMTDKSLPSQQINAADHWIPLEEGEQIGQYYQTKKGIFWKARVDYEVTGADSPSFVVNKVFNTYARDKSHAYYFGLPLVVDLESFMVLDQDFHKDKNQVYLGGHTLEGADPNTFMIIDFKENFGKFYSKDQHSVYSQWNKIVDADPVTFQPLGQSYAKDKHFVYLSERKVEGGDPATFKIMNANGYSHDKNNVYWRGQKLKDADPATFKIMEPKRFYAKDQQSVYYYAKKLEGADVGSFQLLDHTYSKDKNAVYYEEKKLEGSDPGSFQIINQNQLLSKDKNGCYRYEKKERCSYL